MNKRLITVFICILMALLVVPVFSFAENESVELYSYSQQVLTEQTVEIPVSLKISLPEEEKLNTLKCTISYDPAILTYSGFQLENESTREKSVAQDAVWAVNRQTEGTITIAFANAYGISNEGYLISLLFRSIKEGSCTVTVKNCEFSTYRAYDESVRSYAVPDMELTQISVFTVLPTDTPTPVPTDTPEPTEEPTETPTPQPTKTPIPTEEPEETDAPTKKPTATPTKKPTATPTKKPTATPTATPTPTPTPTGTPVPTATPSPTPTAAPSPTGKTGKTITDGEGGCSSLSNSTIGIWILDIGIAFIAIQIIIVVLIILRKRKNR